MEKENEEMYVKPDALDKKYKPLILKWLAKQFGYINYPHSFKDQWINWSVWEGELWISFDKRVFEHKVLKLLIPDEFFGTTQKGTLKIVNKDNFYLKLSTLITIEYPDITDWKLLRTYFYNKDLEIFCWQIFLSDGSSIYRETQENNIDFLKGDYVYNHVIQQRAFCRFLDKLENKK